ncbi:hypothetical protein [Chryseobacterium sp. GP-SGM7]|uniref:hypothetical protein n=1 Tax=Chryseobacterium sp. GP-SGM7 TaxID=3411323 RepID=UPI003B92B5ED
MKLIINKVKAESIDYILVVIANLAFALIFIFGYYRFAWFGVLPGYAPHNFGFNVLVILPLLVITSVFSVIVLSRVLSNRNKRKNNLDKYLTILLTLPILFFILRFVILMIWNLILKGNY